MKPTMNRLQILLSLVKNIAARPAHEGEAHREPWELATGKLEQLEMDFDFGPGGRVCEGAGEGAIG